MTRIFFGRPRLSGNMLVIDGSKERGDPKGVAHFIRRACHESPPVGALVLLLAGPALPAGDKSPTPREQYDALVKEAQQAQQGFLKAVREAKTPEDRQKVYKENTDRMSQLGDRFLALAEMNARDAVALDALLWVATQNTPRADKAKATAQLLRDHARSERLGPPCQNLARGYDKESEALLRGVLARNPHKSVQAEAALALAQHLNLRSYIAQRMKDNVQLAGQLEAFSGKEVAEDLKKADVAALEAATEKAYTEFAEKYSSEVPAERLTMACQQLSLREAAAVEPFLRALEKDRRREVQGVACLTLAQILKGRSDALNDKDAKAAARARKESEELFGRAADKYADVKIPYGGSVGEKAKSELFELHHLSIGMQAPGIEGEDQDGKKFKLSDYRGKVVLLDFWSQF
jgi:hypothetical protein